jgi:hypothetical protein
VVTVAAGVGIPDPAIKKSEEILVNDDILNTVLGLVEVALDRSHVIVTGDWRLAR